MSDPIRYPNYVGVEAKKVTSLQIKLKYTDNVEKNILASVGSLATIGYSTNVNGVIGYELIMGVIRDIGYESERTARSFNSSNVFIANTYYIKVDVSTTYASDVKTVYVRDIRDMMVGPMAEGDYNIVKLTVSELPVLDMANKDMYLGKILLLTENTESDLSGLYICLEDAHKFPMWRSLTAGISGKASSPLIDYTDIGDPVQSPIFHIACDVHIDGSSIEHTRVNGTLNPWFMPNESDIMPLNYMLTARTGICVSYQVHLESFSKPPMTLEIEDSDYDEIVLGSVDSNMVPLLADTPIIIGRAYDIVLEDWISVYHRVNLLGQIILQCPKANTTSIKSLNIGGQYLL